jgi:uncharacterized metal-binding protein YceD (DUF177 family)
MKSNELIWSLPVAVDDIPDAGLHMDIDAPADVRAGIAAFASLRALPRLSATFDLVKHGARVAVTGQVSATVGQSCVVTLEPIEKKIEEAVDIVFAPLPVGATADPERGRRRKGADEPPEHLVEGVIDLGALASEFLILGIDPYPRKAGAQFTPPEPQEDGPHPFAALEALKKRSGTQKS